MMHLVLDGIWARPKAFWWPFLGTTFPSGGLPEFEHPVAVTILLELIGLACLVWSWRAFGMSDSPTRDRFLRTGQLARSVPNPPSC